MVDSLAFVAQLGERKTEDLKVRGSIPRGGIFFIIPHFKQNSPIERPNSPGIIDVDNRKASQSYLIMVHSLFNS